MWLDFSSSTLDRYRSWAKSRAYRLWPIPDTQYSMERLRDGQSVCGPDEASPISHVRLRSGMHPRGLVYSYLCCSCVSATHRHMRSRMSYTNNEDRAAIERAGRSYRRSARPRAGRAPNMTLMDPLSSLWVSCWPLTEWHAHKRSGMPLPAIKPCPRM